MCCDMTQGSSVSSRSYSWYGFVVPLPRLPAIHHTHTPTHSHTHSAGAALRCLAHLETRQESARDAGDVGDGAARAAAEHTLRGMLQRTGGRGGERTSERDPCMPLSVLIFSVIFSVCVSVCACTSICACFYVSYSVIWHMCVFVCRELAGSVCACACVSVSGMVFADTDILLSFLIVQCPFQQITRVPSKWVTALWHVTLNHFCMYLYIQRGIFDGLKLLRGSVILVVRPTSGIQCPKECQKCTCANNKMHSVPGYVEG